MHAPPGDTPAAFCVLEKSVFFQQSMVQYDYEKKDEPLPGVCRMYETRRGNNWTTMQDIWRATDLAVPDSWTIWCRSTGS